MSPKDPITAGTIHARLDAMLEELRQMRAETNALHTKVAMLAKKKPEPDAILTTYELANVLRVGVATVFRYKRQGMPVLERPVGSTARDHGRVIRYRYGDVLAWLSQRKVDAK